MGDKAKQSWQRVVVPFVQYSDEIELYTVNGKHIQTLKADGKVYTGAGYGSRVAVLVHADTGGRTKCNLDIYDQSMRYLQHRIAVEHAEDDQACRVDISRSATRVVVLTRQGQAATPQTSLCSQMNRTGSLVRDRHSRKPLDAIPRFRCIYNVHQ
jgi:hypothetical protein